MAIRGVDWDAIEEKIQAVQDWADTRTDFDCDFVDSLGEQLERQGELSLKQVNALDNIIERFYIEV